SSACARKVARAWARAARCLSDGTRGRFSDKHVGGRYTRIVEGLSQVTSVSRACASCTRRLVHTGELEVMQSAVSAFALKGRVSLQRRLPVTRGGAVEGERALYVMSGDGIPAERSAGLILVLVRALGAAMPWPMSPCNAAEVPLQA